MHAAELAFQAACERQQQLYISPELLIDRSAYELTLEPHEVAARNELAHARQPQVGRDHALAVAPVHNAAPVWA